MESRTLKGIDMAKKTKRDVVDIQSQEPPIRTLEEVDADLAAMQKRSDEMHHKKRKDADKEHADAEEDAHQARCFWPEGEKLPRSHRRATRQPCRKCRRIFMDNGGQAVVLRQSTDKLADFRCKVCGETFSLPVEETR